MTEAEWLAAHDPFDLLTAIRESADAKRLWQYVTLSLYGIGADASVDLLQTHFAGAMEQDRILDLRNNLEAVARQRSGGGYSQGRKPVKITKAAIRARVVLAALQQSPWSAAEGVTQETRHQLQRSQCDWLRCLFSNPFRPVTLNVSWLTSTVLALANGIYDEKAFDRMPILADALQDADCNNEDILNHCRQPGEHVKGCWVVDLLLDRK
jgi:hypothetical protein